MKTFLLALVAVVLTAGTTFAQEQGSMKLGAGLAYGTEAGLDEEGSKGGLGIYVGGEYFFTEKISAAPSFTYFFKSKADFYGAELSGQASTLDIDGRYYFASSETVSFYGMAGLSVAFAKVEFDGEDSWGASDSASDNKAGVNVGAGLVYPITETLDLNAQIKYNTPLEQLAIQVGIAFPIN
jgi:opacity protein-like surface antigen